MNFHQLPTLLILLQEHMDRTYFNTSTNVADCRAFINLSLKLSLIHNLLPWYFPVPAQSCYFFLVGTVLEMQVLYQGTKRQGPREGRRGRKRDRQLKAPSYFLFTSLFLRPSAGSDFDKGCSTQQPPQSTVSPVGAAEYRAELKNCCLLKTFC